MLMVILRQGALFSIVTETSWSVISMMRNWDMINFCKSLVFPTVVGDTPRSDPKWSSPPVTVGVTPRVSGAGPGRPVVAADEFSERG